MQGSYSEWFQRVAGVADPHPWQVKLGEQSVCADRLIRIPTGFGKTAGTVLPWLFHRVEHGNLAWPTRLAFCLPMRTLVEQTETEIRGWFERAGMLDRVGLHVLMGGCDAGPWRLRPEKPAVLVGTQDMLLSRALNRGYGAGRGSWPMEFGLLHHDVLWIFDEVQLQDVGLATSAQLAAFRAHDDQERGHALRPARTWWMSATLQPTWLETVDHAPRVRDLVSGLVQIPAKERRRGLWEVKKALRHEIAGGGLAKPAEIAKLALAEHARGSLSLVILNTVKRAAEVFAELESALGRGEKTGSARKQAAATSGPELKLVHSRFRGAERREWATRFLSRNAKLPDSGGGRIIVTTQVVEAGVNISAALLVTDLAPWPSLVQRFGRAARYEGETGKAVVFGGAPDEKQARPYDLTALKSAADALAELVRSAGDASPASLERFEESLSPEKRAELYPYEPLHVLRRRDLDQLFDTSADLSGADVDISRFIRSGDERDVVVYWRELPADLGPTGIAAARREELCPVPVGDIKEWLRSGRSAWRYDYLQGEWRRADASHIAPGMEILIAANEGGYLPASGWTPASRQRVDPVPPAAQARAEDERLEEASRSEDEEALSAMDAWKTIAVHGREVGDEASQIARALGLAGALPALLDLAGRAHDLGKRLPPFQSAIKKEAREAVGGLALSQELAKAPKDAWEPPSKHERRGLRHELASALALFELLRRADSMHAALLGPHREVFAALGELPQAVPEAQRLDAKAPFVAELVALEVDAFDLLSWLVCTHHGKVRCAWTSTPKDQESRADRIHGVLKDEKLPPASIATASGGTAALPELELSLSLAELGLGARYGASWGERVCRLLERHGPFKLAYLEALLRAADWRVSAATDNLASKEGR